MKIDKNIAGLVSALNALPGIDTFSSCGGHRHPDRGQAPFGCFVVGFDVAQNRTDWQSLAILLTAVQSTNECFDNARRHLWVDPDDGSPNGIHFELDGINRTSPKALAKAIRDMSQGE